ncbi:MAG TPA: ImmA/IrrE family metallo-endopeptidase [Sphingobium sp.]|uniref:ImmA/IrrE family metallo-endopeptidase n=1 Tax=Sphingobium sp. TaxID=1912891 RepID=UPI002ED41C7E
MQNDALLKELAECGSPETLLAAILKHYPDLKAPIDIEAIAQRVGITEFRDLETPGASSAMMTDIGKAKGVILCAPGLSAQRRRFAIAHQLGHFLITSQRGDRQCTNRDLAESRRDTPHRKEEMQANRFAAGLLMPKPLFSAFVDGLGKLTVTHLHTIAAAYDVTLEAAASRYADLTQAMCALIFIKDGVVRYARPSRSFPPLSIEPGAPVPAAVKSAGPEDKIAWLPAEVRDWLSLSRDARPPKLTMQILSKANGFQLVMLFVNAAAERRADEEAEKLATERPKFGR